MRSLKWVFFEIGWFDFVFGRRFFKVDSVRLQIFDVEVDWNDRIGLLNFGLVFNLSNVIFLVVLYDFKCEVFIQILVCYFHVTGSQRNLLQWWIRFLKYLHVVLCLILAGKLRGVVVFKLFGLGFIDILFFSRLIFLDFVFNCNGRLVILHFLVLNERLFLSLILKMVHYYIPTFCFKF